MSGSILTAALFAQMVTACPVHGVSMERMAAHAKVESGFSTTSINDNTTHRSYNPDTKTEAVVLLRQLVAAGHSVDAGPMQINNANWRDLGLTAETVMDPQTNVCAGKQFIAWLYDRERRVSCLYNTGKPQCGNGYPEKVEAARIALAGTVAGTQPPFQVGGRLEPPNWDVWERESPTQPPVTPTPPITVTSTENPKLAPIALQMTEIP